MRAFTLSLVLGAAFAVAACQPRGPEPAGSADPGPVAVGATAGSEVARALAGAEGLEAPGVGSPATPGEAHEAGEATDGDDEIPRFGAPLRAGPLAVYPITLTRQSDPGPIITLDDALARGLAEVREVGADAAAGDALVPVEPNLAPPVQQRRGDPTQTLNVPQRQLANGGGATVGTLVIENRSEAAIFVLAGTVVKGGKQDRQIGQDFVVDAGQTVPVDAFCVERGRWDAERHGEATGGRFDAAKVLATSKVRAAGQYKQSQGEVWEHVAQANAAHDKTSPSDSLFATLDDEAVKARVEALAGAALAALRAHGDEDTLVGFAWAVDGRLLGARWFAHRRVFALFRETLLRTAAVDALTAEAREAQAGRTLTDVAPPPAADLERLVAEVDAAAAAPERTTAGMNDNVYQESERAWGSKTMLRKAAAIGAAPSKARPLSVDYLMK